MGRKAENLGIIALMTGSAFIVTCILCANFILAALLWPFTINFWLDFAGKPDSFMWYHGLLLGFVPLFGQLCIPLSLITFIASFFI